MGTYYASIKSIYDKLFEKLSTLTGFDGKYKQKDMITVVPAFRLIFDNDTLIVASTQQYYRTARYFIEVIDDNPNSYNGLVSILNLAGSVVDLLDANRTLDGLVSDLRIINLTVDRTLKDRHVGVLTVEAKILGW